jgi:hypothetical protein
MIKTLQNNDNKNFQTIALHKKTDTLELNDEETRVQEPRILSNKKQ